MKTPIRVLSALALLAIAGSANASVDLYPTDRCVAAKLAATGQHCRAVLTGAALGGGRLAALFEAFSRGHLAQRWDRAEARSLAEGVDCAETTVTSDEMADRIAAGVEAIASDRANSHRKPSWFVKRWRTSQDLLAAAHLCDDLLEAEARHLRTRDTDRERERLERNRKRALRHYGSAKRGGWLAWLFDGFRRGGADHAAAVQALVTDAVHATTISPNVSTEWTRVDPDAEVPYHAEYVSDTFAPICSRGTPWVFFVKRGSVNKLFVHYQGGGACWDSVTCGTTFTTFDTAVDPERENPANFGVGLYDFENEDNPFRHWHHVFVPYCTGDVHWGGTRFVHESVGGGDPVTIEHKGWHNARVAEKWFREHFVHPDQVFVTGSSAGAYGAIVNSLPMQEYVYPSADFAVLGDAGNGVITQDFLENDISKWGVEENLPAWIPALNLPLTELDAADLWVSSAEFYPQNRFATYTTAYDGSTGGQTGFFWVMLNPIRENPANVLQWPSWWEASCLWNSEMRRLNGEAVSRASNYRFYVGTGSRHTIEFNDKLYTDTTGGVPTFVSWVEAMLGDTPDWTNVECEDCGVLLPGDPRPPGAVPPFTAEGRIVCE